MEADVAAFVAMGFEAGPATEMLALAGSDVSKAVAFLSGQPARAPDAAAGGENSKAGASPPSPSPAQPPWIDSLPLRWAGGAGPPVRSLADFFAGPDGEGSTSSLSGLATARTLAALGALGPLELDIDRLLAAGVKKIKASRLLRWKTQLETVGVAPAGGSGGGSGGGRSLAAAAVGTSASASVWAGAGALGSLDAPLGAACSATSAMSSISTTSTASISTSGGGSPRGVELPGVSTTESPSAADKVLPQPTRSNILIRLPVLVCFCAASPAAAPNTPLCRPRLTAHCSLSSCISTRSRPRGSNNSRRLRTRR